MKAWEALEILEGLDHNAEVMLTIGKPKKPKEGPQAPTYYPTVPYWVKDSEFTLTPPYTITCKSH